MGNKTKEQLKKEIDRLENLEKTITIMKTKDIYISDFTFNTFITYNDYFYYYVNRRHFAINEIPTKEEYELLKEVLQNE